MITSHICGLYCMGGTNMNIKPSYVCVLLGLNIGSFLGWVFWDCGNMSQIVAHILHKTHRGGADTVDTKYFYRVDTKYFYPGSPGRGPDTAQIFLFFVSIWETVTQAPAQHQQPGTSPAPTPQPDFWHSTRSTKDGFFFLRSYEDIGNACDMWTGSSCGWVRVWGWRML